MSHDFDLIPLTNLVPFRHYLPIVHLCIANVHHVFVTRDSLPTSPAGIVRGSTPFFCTLTAGTIISCKGEFCKHFSWEAVAHLRKSLVANGRDIVVFVDQVHLIRC